MIITQELRRSIVEATKHEHAKLQAAANEAYRVHQWALNLRIGENIESLSPNPAPKPAPIEHFVRYYIPSKSGLTKGHYIRKFASGIDCSCPGFVNRGYCWASTKIKSNATDSYKYLWNKSTSVFDSNRDFALRLAQPS